LIFIWIAALNTIKSTYDALFSYDVLEFMIAEMYDNSNVGKIATEACAFKL
jgi:hypothetical protein